jgi:hypothetical protein
MSDELYFRYGIPRYAEFLTLKNKPNRSFEENQKLGELTIEVALRALFRFQFLDKNTLMFFLQQSDKNQGSFYRLMKTLMDRKWVRKVDAPYLQSKHVYMLRRKAFEYYLPANYADDYVFNKSKIGLGVSSSHKLFIARMIISLLIKEPESKFQTEREIRYEIKLGRLKLYRVPDAIFYGYESITLLEFEFSEKNRLDRLEALVKAELNVYRFSEKYEDWPVSIVWGFVNKTLKKRYENEVEKYSERALRIDGYGNSIERHNPTDYFDFTLDRENHEFILFDRE